MLKLTYPHRIIKGLLNKKKRKNQLKSKLSKIKISMRTHIKKTNMEQKLKNLQVSKLNKNPKSRRNKRIQSKKKWMRKICMVRANNKKMFLNQQKNCRMNM